MRLLAIDTATEFCNVGLAADGTLLAELSLRHGQTHAKHLLQGIQTVLAQAEVGISAIDGLAVTRGPGSFTGLRIGLSTAKGMALALGIPITGVSSLAVLAHQAQTTEGLICPMIDARRKEVYWALYRRTASGLAPVLGEQVGPANVAAAGISHSCVFIGNGAVAYRSILCDRLGPLARFEDPADSIPRIAVVAQLAWRDLVQGTGNDLHGLSPVYLRRSDAELNFSNKEALANSSVNPDSSL
jgi:tRNA threonylcarbamoyladenosine biosynthesis protein TsaB